VYPMPMCFAALGKSEWVVLQAREKAEEMMSSIQPMDEEESHGVAPVQKNDA